MKKTMALLITFTLIFTAVELYAKDDSGHNLVLFGDSGASLGRGGTGITLSGSDLFYLNPASIASSERIEFGLQYGTLDMRFKNPALSFAMPTSYGVVGASFRMIDIPSNATDIERGYMLNIGGAKEFTRKILIGASLNGFMGSDPEDSLNYFGLTIGSIYRVDYYKNFKKGFMIKEPAMGISVNAGIPIGENKDLADFNQIALGASTIFYSSKNINLKLLAEVNAINSFDDFPVKLGLESLIFENYIARAGTTVPAAYDYGTFTVGLGYKFKTEDFDADINYALVHYDGTTFNHYLGLNIKYGELDRTPPEVSLESTEEYISPNFDGKQDFLFFKPMVKDESRIAGWKLQLKDSKNLVMREFKKSERDMEEDLTLKGFFQKIWQKK